MKKRKQVGKICQGNLVGHLWGNFCFNFWDEPGKEISRDLAMRIAWYGKPKDMSGVQYQDRMFLYGLLKKLKNQLKNQTIKDLK